MRGAHLCDTCGIASSAATRLPCALVAWLGALAVAGALCAGPATAWSQTLQARSSTYLQGYVRPATGEAAQYVPFYELVELKATHLGVEGLSLQASLWGLIDLVDKRDRYRATGDVNTLSLDYRVPAEARGTLAALRGLRLTVGRQFVAMGPSILEQVDGGKAHYLHSSGLEVGLFGGAPTGIKMIFQPWPLDDDRYDYGYSWLVGGRLGYVNLGSLSGGVSYVHRELRGDTSADELGADLRWSALSWLDLLGASTISLQTLRAKEGKASLALRPLQRVSLDLGYTFSSPDLWLPRTSIFAVFSEETWQEAALSARWQLDRQLSLEGGYGRRIYSQASDGEGSSGANRATLEGTYRFGHARARRAVAQLERLEAPDNAANRLRLATSQPFYLGKRTLRLIADLNLMVLDDPLRDTRWSVLAGGYLMVPLIPQLSLLVGGSGGATPLLSSSGRFMARLSWDFDLGSSKSGVQVQRTGGI